MRKGGFENELKMRVSAEEMSCPPYHILSGAGPHWTDAPGALIINLGSDHGFASGNGMNFLRKSGERTEKPNRDTTGMSEEASHPRAIVEVSSKQGTTEGS